MLPVCSATTSCSSLSQVSLHKVWLPFSLSCKKFEVRCIVEDRVALGLLNEMHLQGISFKRQAVKSFSTGFFESTEQSCSKKNFINMSSYQNEVDSIKHEIPNNWSYSPGTVNKNYSVGMGDLKFVESTSVSAGEEEIIDFTDRLGENTKGLPKLTDPQTMLRVDGIPDDPTSVSDSLNMDNDSLSSVKMNVEDTFSGINESISDSVNKLQHALKNSLNTIASSVASSFKSANEAFDAAVGNLKSAVDQTGELAGNKLTEFSSDLRDDAGNKLTGFSSDLRDVSSKLGVVVADVLRRTIFAVEDSLTHGATFVVYAYGSAKELLPSEIQNVLNLSEETAVKILMSVGTAFQQIYVVLEGVEKSLGLDPNDPIIPFVLFFGASATLWGSYWVLINGGYAGDLSADVTLELLTGKENAVLIDVRPEDLRERDGIPDLRRAARFRYANITLPKVDGSVLKLLKSGVDVDDFLIAAVIRNLKIVQDRSKVIVMDADGTRSKGIARSLRRLGIKKPYLVQDGFQSWVKVGLRVKELKPQTTLTILNEEAEAILEDFNPTPLKVVGYGVGFIAAAYALFEWEKTLQLIGVVGLGQTIYWRIASYEGSEDFKQDVRLLLAPVRLGGQAISWAAGKLETSRNGLPISPSSPDVQSRVLQAAAKHESQPSDTEERQGSSSESMNENVDLSGA